MTPLAASLLTYVWRYLVARLLYDHLIVPLAKGGAAEIVLVALVAALSFALGRRTRRRA
jgi:hypothetical protein